MGESMVQEKLRPAEGVLILRVCDGDREAFYELVRPYERSIYFAAKSVLENDADAEDAAQEAVLKAFTHIRDFRRRIKVPHMANPDHDQ
jgi:RNA polymerase sigma-70 factor, ECF subfamily